MRPGWYCIRRSRVLTSAVSWGDVTPGEIGQGPFQVRPDRLGGVKLGGAGETRLLLPPLTVTTGVRPRRPQVWHDLQITCDTGLHACHVLCNAPRRACWRDGAYVNLSRVKLIERYSSHAAFCNVTVPLTCSYVAAESFDQGLFSADK
jgi:hypothetical protein